jgi:hypothetical protein
MPAKASATCLFYGSIAETLVNHCIRPLLTCHLPSEKGKGIRLPDLCPVNPIKINGVEIPGYAEPLMIGLSFGLIGGGSILTMPGLVHPMAGKVREIKLLA